MGRLTFTELHIHTEYSLKDGMIRVAHPKDPKGIKEELVQVAERNGTGAITSTDHGNMYGHGAIAQVAKAFGLKYIPACEFYMSPDSRFNKDVPKGGEVYRHINAWGKNKDGYRNLCLLQDLSYSEGFYHQPRIDKELINKYGDNIMWSDACIGGTLGSLIQRDRIDDAYAEFMWFLNRFKDDFYIEYQNHHIEVEERANKIKIEWANKHGVPVIATSDAHFFKKEDELAHKVLLCIQYDKVFDDLTQDGFPGDGYYTMTEDELIERFPIEYLNNTQLIVDKVEGGIIKFGEITPPRFAVPKWFTDKYGGVSE